MVTAIGMIRRTLRRRYAAIVIAILGTTFILVGVAVSILSLTAFRPFPFRDPAMLVQFMPLEDGGLDPWQRDTLMLVRPAIRAAKDVAAYTMGSADVQLGGATRTPMVVETTDNFFSMLGLRVEGSGQAVYGSGRAVIARTLLDAAGVDAGDVVGKSIIVGNRSVVVTGIVAAMDAFPVGAGVWVSVPAGEPVPGREWFAIARVGNASDAELVALQGRTALQGLIGPLIRASIMTRTIDDVARPSMSSNQRALSGGIAIFAIIAILNYALLSVGEARRRAREFGVRVALGATARRVAAAFLAEQGILIATALLIAGVTLGIARTFAASADGGQQIPGLSAIPSPVWSMIGLGLVGLIGVALIPWRVVAQFAGAGPIGGNAIGAASSERIRTHAFIGLQFAVTAFLIVTAGCAAMMMYITHNMEFGFTTENVTFASVNFATPALQDSLQAKLVVARAEEALHAALPDQQVAVWGTTNLDGVVKRGQKALTIDGPTLPKPPGARQAQMPFLSQDVSPNFFDVLGIRVLRGRGFLPSDRDGAPPVAVVSELMAKRIWGIDNAIGKRMRLGQENAPWLTVVGVVAQTQPIEFTALDWEHLGLRYPLMYRSLAQTVPHALINPGLPHGGRTVIDGILVRDYGFSVVTRGPTDRNLKAISTVLTRVAPQERLARSGPLIQYLDHAGLLAMSAFTTKLLAGFTAAGLALAIFDAACLIDEVIRQRTSEIGIRMALGAQPRSLIVLTGRGTFMTGVIGTLVGSMIGSRLGPDVELWLTGQTWTDLTKAFPNARVAPGVLFTVGAVALLLLVLAAGTIWRSRRATRLNPLEALRVQ